MSNVPGFPDEETRRPPSKRELAQQAREVKALRLWYQTGDEGEVRRALKLPSNAAARVMINRAVETWKEHEVDHVSRVRTYQDHLLLMSARKLAEKIEEGELQRIPDLVKVMDRMSKLHDLDAQKDVAGGPSIVVIDSRPPWERGDVIDEAPDALEPPAGTEGS